MKKIAIKYSEENWANIKVAVDLIRSTGLSVEKRKEYHSMNTATHLSFIKSFDTGFQFDWGYNTLADANWAKDCKVLEMPEDMPKLKEFLGVEVPAKSVEVPKDGEVWGTCCPCGDIGLYRFRELNNEQPLYYSSLDTSNNEFCMSKSGYWGRLDETHRKATPEEEAKLIETEHANGYHWDGNSLVNIPEYVEIIDNKYKKGTWEKSHLGKVCKVVGGHPISGYDGGLTINSPKGGAGYLFNGDFKPSTKEAYEAQEAKKSMNYKDYIKRIDLIVANAELKQTIKTLSSTADTLAQDNAELTKKLHKIKGLL